MAMLLRGHDGTEFEIGIIEEPDLAPDGDPLAPSPAMLTWRAAAPDSTWEETVPRFNPYELWGLLDWLEAVGAGRPCSPEVELLEPELRFSIARSTARSVTLRIGLHLPDRPERFNVTSTADGAGFVDLVTSRAHIADAARELRRDLDPDTPDERRLAEFPARDAPPDELLLAAEEEELA